MSDAFSDLTRTLKLSSEPLREALTKSEYTPPESSNVSIKSHLLSLLPSSNANIAQKNLAVSSIRDFTLCCAALSAASESTSDQLLWIPNSLSIAAVTVFKEFACGYYDSFGKGLVKIGDVELELDLEVIGKEKRLIIELMHEVLPLLKNTIKDSSIDASDESSAASARAPVAYAIIAAHQFRWFSLQLDYPYLGKLSTLVIPCALTALDHWSADVKGQGMLSFIHLAKNVNATDISWYEDVILDACCQNIASDDELWKHVVEMSVLLVTLTQRNNPRSPWYEKLLNEMLNHLERQPRNKERRVEWLKHIDPLFSSMGIVLLAHFRCIFPLFFRWMHADDDDTVILVLERIKTILRLTWIRNSSFTERLVDELVTLYKEAAFRVTSREDIRSHVLQTLILLQQSKSSQFEAAWRKHKEDLDLVAFHGIFSANNATAVV